MTIRQALRAAWVAGGLIGTGVTASAQSLPLVSPSYGAPPAPSEVTIRLLALTRPTAAFLARSSRLAETQARSARLKGFARREAREQDRDLDALAEAAAPVVVTRDPLDLAAAGAASVDAASEGVLARLSPLLQTPGARSVAADRAIAASANRDLAALAVRDGRAFDALYVETQREGLLRLIDVYRNYVQNGDDTALRALSVHALPRMRARLAALPGHG